MRGKGEGNMIEGACLHRVEGTGLGILGGAQAEDHDGRQDGMARHPVQRGDGVCDRPWNAQTRKHVKCPPLSATRVSRP